MNITIINNHKIELRENWGLTDPLFLSSHFVK